MTNKTDCGKNGCTYQWKIKNISHCWLKLKKEIASPTFIADSLGGTQWELWFFPMGWMDENKVNLYLFRHKDSCGPEKFEVNYHLAILDKDGEILKEVISKYLCPKNKCCVVSLMENRKKVFITDKETFLPEDTLTVQCRIWNQVQTTIQPSIFFARTVYKVNRNSFIFKIDKFSTLKSGLKNKFKDEIIEFDFVLSEGLNNEKKLTLNINSFNESVKYFSFKASILDTRGEKEDLGTHEYFTENLKQGAICMWFLTKKWVENRAKYLPNDVLSLDCEYICSNGIVLYEHCCCGTISPNLTNDVDKSKKSLNIEKEEFVNTETILNDFKIMFSDRIFSDIELHTSTQNFPAHKAILSARSPVFRRMFSNDMKEKICKHVDITDFEDETIQRMLLYMYTDSLADLQFAIALKLYKIADKYEILSLKSRCSSFLKENLCPTNSCDALVLSDLHFDDDLKNYVQDFILTHDKAVFGTQEWIDLMNTHLKLAADIMYRKVKP